MRKADQFSDSLDVEFWYVTLLLIGTPSNLHRSGHAVSEYYGAIQRKN